MLRHARRGAFAFAIYNTVPVRDEVVAVLSTLVAPLPVFDFTLSQGKPNPLAYLEALPPDARAGRLVVFIYDLDRAGEETWGYLDAQREALVAYPHGAVFWVTEKGARETARRAPNVWRMHSGVFDFRIESQPVLAQVRAEWAGQPVRIERSEDWERLYRLYSGLLEEYKADSASPSILGDLHGKVAYLLYRGYRHEEAKAHLESQLSIAREVKDPAMEAWALTNIGNVQQFRKENDAALSSYEQALGLFRAVGDRLGEANVYMSIGDLRLGEQDWPEASRHYEMALPIYREIGARLGQANTLIDLGRAYFQLGQRGSGMAYVKEAGDLYAAIGRADWAIRASRRLAEMLKQTGRTVEAEEIERVLAKMDS